MGKKKLKSHMLGIEIKPSKVKELMGIFSIMNDCVGRRTKRLLALEGMEENRQPGGGRSLIPEGVGKKLIHSRKKLQKRWKQLEKYIEVLKRMKKSWKMSNS